MARNKYFFLLSFCRRKAFNVSCAFIGKGSSFWFFVFLPNLWKEKEREKKREAKAFGEKDKRRWIKVCSFFFFRFLFRAFAKA